MSSSFQTEFLSFRDNTRKLYTFQNSQASTTQQQRNHRQPAELRALAIEEEFL